MFKIRSVANIVLTKWMLKDYNSCMIRQAHNLHITIIDQHTSVYNIKSKNMAQSLSWMFIKILVIHFFDPYWATQPSLIQY